MTLHPCGPHRCLTSNTVTSSRCLALRPSFSVNHEAILFVLIHHLNIIPTSATSFQGWMWVLGHTRCRRSHPVRCNDPSTCPAPTAAIPQVLRFPTLLKAHFYIGRVHLVSRHHPLTLFSASRPSMSVWACVGLVVPLLMHPMAVGPMNSWQNFRTLDSQLSAPPLCFLCAATPRADQAS